MLPLISIPHLLGALTCKDVKTLYKDNACCGEPENAIVSPECVMQASQTSYDVNSLLSNLHEHMQVGNNKFHFAIDSRDGSIRIRATEGTPYSSNITLRKDGAVDHVCETMQDCIYSHSLIDGLITGPTESSYAYKFIVDPDGLTGKSLSMSVLATRLRLWDAQNKIPPHMKAVALAMKAGYEAAWARAKPIQYVFTRNADLYHIMAALINTQFDFFGSLFGNVANVVSRLNSRDLTPSDTFSSQNVNWGSDDSSDKVTASSYLALGKNYMKEGSTGYMVGTPHWYNLGFYAFGVHNYHVQGKRHVKGGLGLMTFKWPSNDQLSAFTVTVGGAKHNVGVAVELVSPTSYRIGTTEYPIEYDTITMSNGYNYLVPKTKYGFIGGRFDERYHNGEKLKYYEGDIFNMTSFRKDGSISTITPKLLCVYDHFKTSDDVQNFADVTELSSVQEYIEFLERDDQQSSGSIDNSAIDKDGYIMVHSLLPVDHDPALYKSIFKAMMLPGNEDELQFATQMTADELIVDGSSVEVAQALDKNVNRVGYKRRTVLRTDAVTTFINHANQGIPEKHYDFFRPYKNDRISATGGHNPYHTYQLAGTVGGVDLPLEALRKNNPSAFEGLLDQILFYKGFMFNKALSNYDHILKAVGLLHAEPDGTIVCSNDLEEYKNPTNKLTAEEADEKLLFNYESAWATRFLPGIVSALESAASKVPDWTKPAFAGLNLKSAVTSTIGEAEVLAAIDVLKHWNMRYDMNARGAGMYTAMGYRMWASLYWPNIGDAMSKTFDENSLSAPFASQLKNTFEAKGVVASGLPHYMNDIAENKFNLMDLAPNFNATDNTVRPLTEEDALQIMIARVSKPSKFNAGALSIKNPNNANEYYTGQEMAMDALLLGIYDLAQVDDVLHLSYATSDGGVTDTTDVATTVSEKVNRTWGSLHRQVLVNDTNPNSPGFNREYPMPSGQDSFYSGLLSEPRTVGYYSAGKTTYGPEYTNNLGTTIFSGTFPASRRLFTRGYLGETGGDAFMQRQVGDGTKLDAKMWKFTGNSALTVRNRYGMYYYQNSLLPPSLDTANPLMGTVDQSVTRSTLSSAVPLLEAARPAL